MGMCEPKAWTAMFVHVGKLVDNKTPLTVSYDHFDLLPVIVHND